MSENSNITFKDSPLVVIVDDDKFIRLQLSSMLEDEGYRVIEASDGEEGLAICSRYSPDIILLDGVMPIMDGFTCCEKLRQISELSNIPILMVTSLEDNQSVDRAFEAGATDYITKPIHWAVLRQRILRLIQASRAEVEIRKALDKEKELNEIKSRFVSMISHEFRVPLNTILSSSELIEQFGHKFTEEKRLTHFKRIKAGVKKLTNLLNEVLQVGKIEAGKLDIQLAVINLNSLCRKIVDDMQLSAGKNYTIKFTSTAHAPQAYIEPRLLESILNNLLSNAIKYSPNGGTVELELLFEDEKIKFRVSDSGIGIPTEEIHQLFTHFHRAKNVGSISGTGLGLSIVKKYVDLMEGEISVESLADAGTTFWVTLPLRQDVSGSVN